MQFGWGTLSAVEGVQADVVRAAVHAFAFGSEGNPKPVHITRITSFYRRYVTNGSALEPLRVISLLKEVIALPGGMWLPGVSRAIPLADSTYLVIAPQPSTELSRVIGGPVSSRLFGRFSSNPVGEPFERQTLADWNDTYSELTSWTKAAFIEAKSHLQTTALAARTIDVCRTWSTTRDSGSGSRWQRLVERSAIPNGMHLCKESAEGSATRYFLGDFFKSELVREADLTRDPIRLRFGLEAITGRTVDIRPVVSGSSTEIEMWRRLPVSELMVLAALATKIEPTTYGARLTFDKTSFIVISSVLTSLGIRVAG